MSGWAEPFRAEQTAKKIGYFPTNCKFTKNPITERSYYREIPKISDPKVYLLNAPQRAS